MIQLILYVKHASPSLLDASIAVNQNATNVTPIILKYQVQYASLLHPCPLIQAITCLVLIKNVTNVIKMTLNTV